MGKDLVGMRGGNSLFDGYNPFDLYGAAERSRGKPLPPHLVFAELDKDVPDDACAFLNAYGPLVGTNIYQPLTAGEERQWQGLASNSPSPENHFRSTLGQVPLLPNPPVPQNLFWAYPLKKFWKDQSEFELALRLHSAMGARTERLQKIRRSLTATGTQWNITGRNSEIQHVERARDCVRTTVNSHLSLMQPRIARVLNSDRVTGVWGCYSLLEAMYLMLFLDIAGWSERIAQCEKCHSLFYTALKKCKYCSPICENRARALRAYHNKKGVS
jgi:hypothetical protein